MDCEVPTVGQDASFEELMDAFGTQSYWVRFFMRPCCPAPGESTARDQIAHLKADLEAHEGLTEEERATLSKKIDEGLAWYLKLPVRHTA